MYFGAASSFFVRRARRPNFDISLGLGNQIQQFRLLYIDWCTNYHFTKRHRNPHWRSFALVVVLLPAAASSFLTACPAPPSEIPRT